MQPNEWNEITPLMGLLVQVGQSRAKLSLCLALATGPLPQARVQAVLATEREAGIKALGDLRDRRLVEKTAIKGKLCYVAAPHFAALGKLLAVWMGKHGGKTAVTAARDPMRRRHHAAQPERVVAVGQSLRAHDVALLALSWIALRPGVTTGELLKHVHTDRSTLKRALTRLESDRLVTRIAEPHELSARGRTTIHWHRKAD